VTHVHGVNLIHRAAIKHPNDGSFHSPTIFNRPGFRGRVIPVPPKCGDQIPPAVVQSQLATHDVFPKLAFGDCTQQAKTWNLATRRLEQRSIKADNIAVLGARKEIIG